MVSYQTDTGVPKGYAIPIVVLGFRHRPGVPHYHAVLETRYPTGEKKREALLYDFRMRP